MNLMEEDLNISKSDVGVDCKNNLVDEKSVAGEQQTSSMTISRAQVEDSIKRYLLKQVDSELRLCRSTIMNWLSQSLARFSNLTDKYHIVYLMNNQALKSIDADRIYQSIRAIERDLTKPVLLVLQSYGGRIEPAYFIGKMLRQFAYVEVAVPRMAKSAATLICCSASHIHMGGLSELGPIDPQIGGVPALGLKNAIQHLAELTVRYPDAEKLFIGYMCKRVEPMDLGYYERVVESTMQYAERLLGAAHTRNPSVDIKSIARKLTYDYKDHGFVIDKQEAAEVFPSGVIKVDTEEYQFSDAIHKELSWMRQYARKFDCDLSLIGCGIDAPIFVSTK